MTKDKIHQILARYANRDAWQEGDCHILSFSVVASINKLEHSPDRVLEILESAKRAAVEPIDHIIEELKK